MSAREKKMAHETSPGGLLAGWARQGVHSFVAAQKIIMDLAAQENALLIGMVREGLSRPGAGIGTSMANIAEKGVENLTAAGKILLDLASDENALVVDGLKEGLRLPVAAGTLAEVARHRVDTLIEMHKGLLDATAEQAHALAESYREQGKFLAAENVTELARHGIKVFVEKEKKFLDLASQEVSAAVKGDKKAPKARRGRMEVLTEVARESADKYVETQKKLLDLAIEQLEETAKAAPGRHKEMSEKDKHMRSTFGELTEKTMKNLASAEKQLLDLATKPVMGGREKDGRRPRHERVSRASKKATATGQKTVAVQA